MGVAFYNSVKLKDPEAMCSGLAQAVQNQLLPNVEPRYFELTA